MSTGKATITSGANQQEVDLPDGNTSVGELLNNYATALNIPTGGDGDNARKILVNGQEQTDDYVVQAGDQIEAVREAGDKG